MIKEALEYIVSLRKPEIIEIDGDTYSDKELSRIRYIPRAKAITMRTLTSLVDYIRSNTDAMDEKMIIHVESPTSVKMYSMLDYERDRECMAVVKAELPDFDFDRFMDHEKFLINMQAKFINTDDKTLLLKFAGTVETGTVSQYGDDGVTQKATVKTGIASKSDCIVPAIVNLKPFRTFLEVDQPESSFIFRMKEDKHYDGVQCAIFEADGGAWKSEAMANIKAYLKDQLNGLGQFTVIS